MNTNKMKNNRQVFNFLIILVAFVVIVQSVVIVSIFKKNTNDVDRAPVSEEMVLDETEVVYTEPVYNLAFSTANTEMVKGKSYPVNLKASSNITNSVDAVSLYIKYDKEAFTVSDLVFSNKLPKPSYSKISDKVGMIVVHYFIAEQDGLKVSKSDILDLLSFNVVAKKVGEYQFEISTGNDIPESVTMIVDNVTSKRFPIESNNLNIKVN